MNIKLSLSQKLQLYIIAITVIFMASAIFFISNRIKTSAIDNAKQYSEELISKHAIQIEKKLNSNLEILRTLSYVVKVSEQMNESEWKPLFAQMYSEVLSENKQLDDIWDSWELQHIDKTWEKSYGRYCTTAYNENNEIRIETELKSLEGDSDQYKRLKLKNNETIDEPYLFSFTGDKNDAELITDLTVPINDNNGNYIGIVGADIRLTKLQNIVNKIKPYENCSAYLITYEGFYSSHPDSKFIGKAIKNDFKFENIIEKIQKGQHFSFSSTNQQGEEFYHIFAPVNVGKTNTPWAISVTIPIESIIKEAKTESRNYIIVGLIILTIIALVIALIARTITRPLRKITQILQNISKGKVNKELITSYKTGDEIEAISIALNKSIDGLIDKTKFAEKIGKKEYNTQLNLLSEDDALGKSLVEMQHSLLEAEKLEIERVKEDEKRKWSNEGLAIFSDILRLNSNSIKELSTVFTRELIKYCNANQGTLFLEDNGHYLSKATYAYDRDKFSNSEILPGEGLVGTCIIEKKSTYLTDIPNGYIKITSGLGEATPNALFICPIQTDKEIVGVLEIASFNKIEEYQRSFIETVCSNLASVVESVKVNEQTKVLLEQTQQQAEEMKAQEEEMRQNLEELQATQEEIAIKSVEMNGVLNALDASSLVLKLDMDGNLIDINQSFLDLLELPKEGVIGKNLSDFTTYANDTKTYEEFWENLRKGIPQKEEQIIRLSNGKEIWLSQVFSTIFNENDEPISIMNIASDITERKLQEVQMMQQNEEMSAQEEMMRLNMEEIEEMQNEADQKSQEINSLLDALSNANFVVEYDTKGNVIEINDNYLDFLDLSKEEALNMSQSDHMKVTSSSKDKLFWDILLEGRPWKGNTQLEIHDKQFTLVETYSPILNDEGEVIKILKIANNITDFKIA